MKKISFALLLFLPLLVLGQKQTSSNLASPSLKSMKEDSLKVNLLNKTGFSLIDTDTVKAFEYSNEALRISKELDWEEGIAKSNFALGTIYNQYSQFDKALVYFNLALETSNQRFKGTLYQSIGNIYINKSDFSKALDYYFRALKIDETLKDKKDIAKISANIGSIYYGIHDFKNALVYFNKAAKGYKETRNENDLAIVYRNIGGVYNSLGQTKKAIQFYEESYQLSQKTKNEMLQARLLSDFALLYYNLNDFDKAINYIQLSLKLKKAIDQQTIAFNHGLLGDAYIGKAKLNKNNRALLDSAFINLNQALKLHKEFKSNRDLAYDYSSLTQVYKLRGDYKNALSTYEVAMVYEDSVFNFDNKETIKSLEDKRSIELRDREIKINKLKLEAKERQKWALMLGLGLLGIIGGLFFYQSRQRRKANVKLAEKNNELDQANKIKARFFSILNHDLRSPVYNLIHFLHLKKENPELLDEEMKRSIEEKTMVSAENLLTSMEDMLLWSKSQMENFKPEPKNIFIADIFTDTEKHFESERNVKILFQNLQDVQIFTDENYLKTIIRNLTGNAIKALEKIEKPTITWKAWQENNQTFLSVTDNGVGATQEQLKALYDDSEVVGIKTGLGLHLIRDLAKAIDCKISVESKENIGTTFTLSFN